MSDFTTFKSQFSGDLVTPTDADYVTSIARWAANAQRRAKIVAFVRTPSDVALAIAYARANSLEIAIRGGGHSPVAASSSEGGLVIDLSRYMNGVSVDLKEKVAYVGGGALWETVDKEAIKHGLATVGGTVNHTGVGGLTLGGGYGWLSGRHGLVIDNLVQATVVTASGAVLTANSTSHPDLFFGIRGGGCNFGVVIEFVYKLHPQRRTIYSGVLIFAPPALEMLVSVTKEWWTNVGEDEGMLQMATVGRDGNPAIVVFLFFNGPEEEGRANFKKFLDIGPVADMTREMPFEELNSLQNPDVFPGQGVYMKGLAHRTPHYPTILQAHAHVIDIHARTQFRPTVLFEYHHLGKITAVPRGATASRRGPTPNVVILVEWEPTSAADVDLGEREKENNEKAKAWAWELAEIIKGGQGVEGITEEEQLGYTNYDPESVPDKARLVFGDNYQRLREVKKMYDPEAVFNKWFSITPA